MYTIGIDVSKVSFHAAFDEKTVRIFPNTKAGIESFNEALSLQGADPTTAIVGMEATGVYHLLLCEMLRINGWQPLIINPLLAHRVITSTLRPVKTDRHDALAIRKALLLGLGQPYTDSPEILALKTLINEREALVRMRAQLKQKVHDHRIRELAIGFKLPDSFSQVGEVLSREIKALERAMASYELGTQKLLRSIPGVGLVTAAALVAHVGDIKRFSSPSKLVAYLGLDCRVYESGSSVKGRGYLSKRGNRYLRYILFNAAFIARKYNPSLDSYFQKKLSEGKHYFSAMCAVERKLAYIIYAVWSRQTPFEKR